MEADRVIAVHCWTELQQLVNCNSPQTNPHPPLAHPQLFSQAARGGFYKTLQNSQSWMYYQHIVLARVFMTAFILFVLAANWKLNASMYANYLEKTLYYV